MEGSKENEDRRQNEVYSEVVKAGKRTYFLDVKSTRAGDHFLVITESKKHFNEDSGKFYYEKHKIFLYKEDFEKFKTSFDTCLEKVSALNEGIEIEPSEATHKESSSSADVNFEDL